MSLSRIDSFVKEVKLTKNIDTSNWKEFKMNDLFDIDGTTTTPINKIRENSGNFPYVTTQATNNGIRFYSSIHTENGNVLVIDSAVLGWMSYQEKDFSASDHVEKLTPKFRLNKEIGLFIISVWNSIYSQKVFNYKKKASQKAIKECFIPLPVNKKGEPDWKYMEDYIKTLSFSCQSPNLSRLEELPKKIKNETRINLSSWKKFKLTDLFNYKRGKRYKKSDHKLGNIAYISSSAKDNGIDNFVSPPNYMTIYENCITLANSGSVGTCFYHNYHFVASDHVHVLWLKEGILKKEIALFLIATIEQNKSKFMFNKEISESTIEEIEFLLPTKDNKPNWEYMNEYINHISKKIEIALK